jgi:BirA family biotin operon repressor/biotin-[acetyl-CoA-carboxylase] ligase
MATDKAFRRVAPGHDDCRLLRALLKTPGAFVSGSQLAEELGVSRPAVWGKLKKLKEAGFEIKAVRNRGYQLNGQPNVLHPALLQLEAEDGALDMECLYFPVIDSTNSEAERQIANGQSGPFAILSSCQTKGRGRQGREWYSATADNLYLTVTYEPRIAPQLLEHFTLWCGIYLCRRLQGILPQANLQIKWPNDLFCEGFKFAGMLTEAKLDSDGIKTLCFGLGLNVNSKPSSYPPEIRPRATSLQAISGEELPINTVAVQALMAIQAAYDHCIQNSDTESLLDAWEPLDTLKGRKVTAEQGGKPVTGIACGIDSSGALCLKQSDGSQLAIRSGDVTLTKF